MDAIIISAIDACHCCSRHHHCHYHRHHLHHLSSSSLSPSSSSSGWVIVIITITIRRAATIIFSEKAVISSRNGLLRFMCRFQNKRKQIATTNHLKLSRVGNVRSSQLIESHFSGILLGHVTTQEGEVLRWTFFLEGNFFQGRRGAKVGIFPRREFYSRKERCLGGNFS